MLDVNIEQKADNKNSSTANYSIELIKDYKTLVMTVIEAKNLDVGTLITVTPYSVNGNKMKFSQNIVFGKEDQTNAYNFPKEENVGSKQFEINYDQSKIL